ncbi:MAG: hypothetical protein LC116_03725 [Bacteroidetes bacterium]|nr:PD40 domain-containing protein [Bacteroidota bacterium]MCZ2132293.1 hypothetical protein [Bacteroidota bacterium]
MMKSIVEYTSIRHIFPNNHTRLSMLLRTIFILTLSALSVTLEMQAQFGKNKVQYDSFSWKFIRSKHFDVYFHQGGEYLARYVAINAERDLGSIERRLNYSVGRRIPIVTYNSHNEFQQSNVIGGEIGEGIGGVTELFKNRVTIPFEGCYDQFKHVICHELAHAVLNDMFYGGSIQNAISNAQRAELPLWMNEGFAEYAAADGYDVKTDMFMRDVALSEYLKGLDNLQGYYAYRGGQAFYWFIRERYGEQKISELINRIRNLPDYKQSFNLTFGMSYEDFSDLWAREMKKIYLPDIEKFEALDDFAERLTNHEKLHNFYNSSPAVSPDGDKTAYIADEDGVFGIYIKYLANNGKTVKLLSSDRALDFEDLNFLTPGISWDPTGKQLAISAKAGGEDALFIVDAVSGAYRRKTFGLKTITSAIWSPDGKNIAFVASKNEQSDLYLYDVAKSYVKKLTDDVFSDQHPTWSPDSKTIYFVSDRADYTSGDFKAASFKMWDYAHETQDIYSLDIASGTISRITHDPKNEKTSLAVAPDGNTLLFVSDKNGIGNLYFLNLATGEITARSNSISGITQLSLANDGSRLLFSSQNKGGFDLFSMRFPLQRKDYGVLPLTKFRQWEAEKLKTVAAITASEPIVPKPSKPIGYGNFDVEFSRQQSAPPNSSVTQSPVRPVIADGTADTALSAPQDYKVSLSTDLIYNNAGFSTFYGLQGATQMLFSDMLGDHQLYLLINLFVDLKNSNFYAAYYYLPNRIDYEFGAFHKAAYVIRGNGMLYRFRNYGLETNASYPFDRFRRLEFGLGMQLVTRENLDYVEEPSASVFAVSPHIKYTFDNTDWGWFGPNRGARYFASISASPKISNSTPEFITFNTDLRQYFSMFGNYINIALRGSGSASFGANPQKAVIGGVDNWINRTFSNGTLPWDSPSDFAFMQYGLPLRGFDVAERRGNNHFLLNAEMRFPLFQALIAGPVPILLQGVQGAFFTDIGAAWKDTFTPTTVDLSGNKISQDLLMSAGIGMRTFVLGLPLRVDVAWRNEFYAWSQPNWLFSLGGNF